VRAVPKKSGAHIIASAAGSENQGSKHESVNNLGRKRITAKSATSIRCIFQGLLAFPKIYRNGRGEKKAISRRNGSTKIRSITKYYKLAGMTYLLINKAVMKQNCIEALNQHVQPVYYYYYFKPISTKLQA